MAIVLAGDDVYFATAQADAMAARLSIAGRTYFRFMDFIYIPTDTENLTPEQVVVVNSLRHRFRRRIAWASNDYVRRVFRTVIENTNPDVLLEVGAGFIPLLPPNPGTEYLCVDMNPAVLPVLAGRGYDAALFGAHDELPLASAKVDLVIAVFVLHFGLSDQQVVELARVLRLDGVFVANVYRRSSESRAALRGQFGRAGFTITVVADEQAVCKDHEFWLASLGSANTQLVADLLSIAMHETV